MEELQARDEEREKSRWLVIMIERMKIFDNLVLFTWCLAMGLITIAFSVSHRYQNALALNPCHNIIILQVAGTTLLVSLGCELVMESVIEIAFPRIGIDYSRGRLGYAVLILSLAFSSSLTPFFFTSAKADIDTLICWSHIGKAIAVFGIINKVNTFGKEIWNPDLSISTVITMWALTAFRLLASRPRTWIAHILPGTTRIRMLIFSNLLIIVQSLILLRRAYVLYRNHFSLKAAVTHQTQQVLSPESSQPRWKAVSFKKESSIHHIYRFACVSLTCALSASLIFDAGCNIYIRLTTDGDDPVLLLQNELRSHILLITIVALLPLRLLRNRLIELAERTKLTDETNGFMRYIVHEVRSPLTTALLGLQCLQSMSTNSDMQEITEDCQFSCQTAMQILNDLLLYDKMERKTIELETIRIRSREFLLQCIRPFRRQLQMDEKKFTIELDDQLQHVYVDIDSSKMEQVMRNFISNAMKFTAYRRGIISVSARFQPKVQSNAAIDPKEKPKSIIGTLYVEVVDNGVGIAPENISRLFGQYVQIEPCKLQEGRGSGLGLFLSKNIVHLHKGSIGVSSQGEGLGSLFFFSLPAVLIPPVANGTDPSSPSSVYTNPDLCKGIALVTPPMLPKTVEEKRIPLLCPPLQHIPQASTKSNNSSSKQVQSSQLSNNANRTDLIIPSQSTLDRDARQDNAQQSSSRNDHSLQCNTNVEVYPSLSFAPASEDTISNEYFRAPSMSSQSLNDDIPSATETPSGSKPVECHRVPSALLRSPSVSSSQQFPSPSSVLKNRYSQSILTKQPHSMRVISKLNRARSSSSHSPNSSSSISSRSNGSMSAYISEVEQAKQFSSTSSDISKINQAAITQDELNNRNQESMALRVLIADDTTIARKMVDRILRSNIGAEVIHANNGFEAILRVQETLRPGASQSNLAPDKDASTSKPSEDDEVHTIVFSDQGDSKNSSPLSPDSQIIENEQFNQRFDNWMSADNPHAVEPENNNAIDVVLMDYHMPGMDGPDTIKQLRHMGYDGCILALSAMMDPLERRACFTAGVNAVLTKPFNLQIFIDTVYDSIGAECRLEFDQAIEEKTA